MSKLTFSLPSTGTILGFIAVLISLGGVGYAAGSFVTIVDPQTNAKARVTGGRLEVSVDEGVTTRIAATGAFFHAIRTVGTGCVTLAAPPSGRALVIQQIRVNTFVNPTPNSGNWVAVWLGANCVGTVVATLNPSTLGVTTIPLGPGFAIPQGQVLSTKTFNSVQAEVYADGFSLPAAQVPPVSDVVAESGRISTQVQTDRPW